MTLLLSGQSRDGRALPFTSPLELQYEADRYVPCDALSFTVPLQWEGTDFHGVTAARDGVVFFDGTADRQTVEKSGSGRLLRLECRSRAALLLDNEVKPYCYFQLTSQQLFERYAAPFGIAGAAFPYPAKRPFLQVKKGASNWTVLEDFCMAAYRKKPYVNRRGILVLDPLNSRTHSLSNRGASGLRYSSVTIQRRNDKLISRLYMKTATETYGYYYGRILDNPYAAGRMVRRERYYHPASKVPADAEEEARRILRDSNREGLLVEVLLPGFPDMEIGDRVRLPDEALTETLYISGISFRMSASGGMVSRLTLMDAGYA